jgi:hypothetical protein
MALLLWVPGLGFALPWLFRGRVRRSLRVRLRSFREYLCIQCGYDLTGSVSGRCPGCGTNIV